MTNIKNLLPLFVFLFLFQTSPAQTKLSLEVGDTMVFLNPQDNNSYRYLDLFVKTRIVDTTRTYNKASGEGFYDYYFLSGDFDAQRLPSSYRDQKCRIVSFREMQDKDKPARMVAFGILDDRTVVWIELDKALQSGEIGVQQ